MQNGNSFQVASEHRDEVILDETGSSYEAIRLIEYDRSPIVNRRMTPPYIACGGGQEAFDAHRCFMI